MRDVIPPPLPVKPFQRPGRAILHPAADGRPGKERRALAIGGLVAALFPIFCCGLGVGGAAHRLYDRPMGKPGARPAGDGAWAVVTIDGVETARYALSQDQTVTLGGEDYNILSFPAASQGGGAGFPARRGPWIRQPEAHTAR